MGNSHATVKNTLHYKIIDLNIQKHICLSELNKYGSDIIELF